MNKTKKITQGAMLLAIVGALMLIDRQLSFIFTDFIVLMTPVVIIIYTSMYKLKDGLVLSVGLAVLTILFGSTTTYTYMPICVIVGMGVSYGISKNYTRQKLTLIAIVLYIIGEIIITFVVTPLLGIDLAEQVSELSTLMEQYGLTDQLKTMNFNITSFLTVIYCASIIIMGVLEGYLTSLLSVLLLKRLKIKNIGINNALDLKISPTLTYVLFGLSVLMFFNVSFIQEMNETLCYIIISVSYMASMVLAYYGYLFMVILGRINSGRKGSLLLILAIIFLFPTSYLMLIIVGFLYGSGPLRNYLEKRINAIKNSDNQNIKL